MLAVLPLRLQRLARSLPVVLWLSAVAVSPIAAQSEPLVEPPAPKVERPLAAVTTDATEIEVTGLAAAGTRVAVYQDLNGDSYYHIGEPAAEVLLPGVLGSGEQPFSLRFPLQPNTTSDRLFVTTYVIHSSGLVLESPSVPLPTIVQERAPAAPREPIDAPPCRGAFYNQCTEAAGIPIAAPPTVDPAALDAAAGIVERMLAFRPDIQQRMAARGAALAIIPRDQPVTALPEFAHLAGLSTPDGRPYDGPLIRGLGGATGNPATSTSEENLLKLPEDIFGVEDVTIHEFGHAVMNLGFSAREAAQWRAIAMAEKDLPPFAGTYASVDEEEFWAEMTQVWFNGATPYNAGIRSAEEMAESAPQAYAFLETILGPPASAPAAG